MRVRTLILLFLAVVLAGGAAILARSWLSAQRWNEVAGFAPAPLMPPTPLPVERMAPRRSVSPAPPMADHAPAPIRPALSPLDAALDNLVSGNIAFNTPDHMTVGKSKIIEAKLSVNLPANELIAQLTEAGKKESTSLQVADRMSATLSGGGAFEISPSGPKQQLISRKQVTTWTWEVTPKQTGTQFLVLSFDAVLTVDGKDGTRTINTFKRSIEVEVAWPETPGEWLEWFKNLFENLSWLWVTVLVPIGLWVWRHLRKKPPSGTPPTDRRAQAELPPSGRD